MNLSALFMFDTSFSEVPICMVNEKLDWETSCKILKGDYTGVELPISFKQSSGKKWTDVLNPNSVSMYIVSQKFIELLEMNNITGWKSYPVILFNKEGKEVCGYFGLSVVGRSGGVDYRKSEVYEKQLAPNGTRNKYYKGLYIDFEQWDGSDFFIPENTLHIIITEKVKEVITKYKITNISLQSLADYEIAAYALPKNVLL